MGGVLVIYNKTSILKHDITLLWILNIHFKCCWNTNEPDTTRPISISLFQLLHNFRHYNLSRGRRKTISRWNKPIFGKIKQSRKRRAELIFVCKHLPHCRVSGKHRKRTTPQLTTWSGAVCTDWEAAPVCPALRSGCSSGTDQHSSGSHGAETTLTWIQRFGLKPRVIAGTDCSRWGPVIASRVTFIIHAQWGDEDIKDLMEFLTLHVMHWKLSECSLEPSHVSLVMCHGGQ